MASTSSSNIAANQGRLLFPANFNFQSALSESVSTRTSTLDRLTSDWIFRAACWRQDSTIAGTEIVERKSFMMSSRWLRHKSIPSMAHLKEKHLRCTGRINTVYLALITRARYSFSLPNPCVAQLVRASSLYLDGPRFESRHTDN